jgi:hypothetical protein
MAEGLKAWQRKGKERKGKERKGKEELPKPGFKPVTFQSLSQRSINRLSYLEKKRKKGEKDGITDEGKKRRVTADCMKAVLSPCG